MSNPFSQLNDDQKEAARRIKLFLSNPVSAGKAFTLTGGPGTGKTFMLKEVLDEYKGSIQGATVSHAAKNILQDSIGDRVKCITLAKLLGLKQSISDDGAIRFIKSTSKQKTSLIGDSKLLVIDEVSQIEDDIYDIIMNESKALGVKVIAVGDPYQLPPVEQEHDSRFFDQIHARLTIPMRFQGPIAELAAVYRNQIDHINNDTGFDKWALNNITHRKDNVEGDTGYSFNNRLEDIIEASATDIKAHPEDVSYARVLAFKNESVAEINRQIRTKIYGSNLAQFERSELVICNGGYSVVGAPTYDMYGNPVRMGGRMPLLYNGQILRVASYKPVVGPEEVPCVLMSFQNFSNIGGHPIFVVEGSFEGKLAYDRVLANLLKDAKKVQDVKYTREAWRRYYAFIESFAYFDYGYSVNLYKAQGQTLTNVYVCEGEVMSIKPLTWKQKFQALYVAMTRAKEKLFIYNKDF